MRVLVPEVRVLLGRVYVSVFLREYELLNESELLLRYEYNSRVPTTLLFVPVLPERRTLCPTEELAGLVVDEPTPLL